MNRAHLLPSLAAIIVTTFAGGCQPSPQASSISGRTMGTTYTVRITGCDGGGCAARYREQLADELQRLNRIFSHYDPGSELSRFNAQADSDWFAVSPELVEVVELAAAVSRQTAGAFDITVAPAVDAWGFGAAAAKQPPGAAGIPAAGYAALESRRAPPALRKRNPALRIDLSAIAKGYAVDRLAYLLEADGLADYLVEIGGELRTAGVRPDGTPWRIGIEPPDSGLAVDYVVTPGNAAVASSGDYRNFYIADGKRIAHTIDPRSGIPVDNGLAAVSVIAPSAAQADALATALMVMGPAAGFGFAQQQELAAMFTTRDGARLQTRYTPAFADYLLESR